MILLPTFTFLALTLPALAHRGGRAQSQEPLVPSDDWATTHMAGSSPLHSDPRLPSRLTFAPTSSPFSPPERPVPTAPTHPLLLSSIQQPIPLSNIYTEEHHIANFEPGAFFTLHDYDSSGGWTPDEVRRTYGLDDEGAKDVSRDKREEVTREVYRLFDVDKNGVVERAEWMDAVAKRVRLPDFGVSGSGGTGRDGWTTGDEREWRSDGGGELGSGHHGDDEYEYEIHHFEKFHDENTKEEDLIHPEDIAHFAKHEREEAEAERLEVLNRHAINEANIPAKFRRQP
ncbi:hypothetical protein MMC13_001109 [Lambiella insularis]|nr:hypothetical protein [Lambiella insularis]